MEITIEDATPIFTITGMEPENYKAAMEGNINAFERKSREQIESILTPNKNTILHIHFTNYTHSVSDTFVEKVLDMCPALLLNTIVKDETILHIAARYGHHKIDPRCSVQDNDRFIDMMEKYFESPQEFKSRQERPQLHYQVGVTPERVEVPKSLVDEEMQEKVKVMPKEHQPHTHVGLDLKWRYFWRIGSRPSNIRRPRQILVMILQSFSL
ncbi:hypothetical protein K1719_011129 [Acacia pycnantha]|nr:hypothetical protein K1719_011129 [Acacia pycnantha]